MIIAFSCDPISRFLVQGDNRRKTAYADSQSAEVSYADNSLSGFSLSISDITRMHLGITPFSAVTFLSKN